MDVPLNPSQQGYIGKKPLWTMVFGLRGQAAEVKGLLNPKWITRPSPATWQGPRRTASCFITLAKI